MPASGRELYLSVRIRPSIAWGAIDGGHGGTLLVRALDEKRFAYYPSRVVRGSDQASAFRALASNLVERPRAGFNDGVRPNGIGEDAWSATRCLMPAAYRCCWKQHAATWNG